MKPRHAANITHLISMTGQKSRKDGILYGIMPKFASSTHTQSDKNGKYERL